MDIAFIFQLLLLFLFFWGYCVFYMKNMFCLKFLSKKKEKRKKEKRTRTTKISKCKSKNKKKHDKKKQKTKQQQQQQQQINKGKRYLDRAFSINK